MKIRILRRASPVSPEYWEAFDYTGTRDISVAGLLDRLNYADDIVNDAGEKTTRIAWYSSCMQGMCGACAMVINGTPALACETFLKDLGDADIELRPLKKFPVIRDLLVDRSSIHENLKRNNIYIGEFQPQKDGKHDLQYDIAKCLKCGLCLEVCPNYTSGSTFYGALFANDCYLVSSRNGAKAGEIRRLYDEHFASACSKSLSCMTVCPMNIPTVAAMANMNRRR